MKLSIEREYPKLSIERRQEDSEDLAIYSGLYGKTPVIVLNYKSRPIYDDQVRKWSIARKGVIPHLGRIDSDNSPFVRIYGVYGSDQFKLPLLVLEELDFNLNELRKQSIDSALCYQIALTVANALYYLHSIGKPFENLSCSQVWFKQHQNQYTVKVSYAAYSAKIQNSFSESSLKTILDGNPTELTSFQKDIYDFGSLLYLLVNVDLRASHISLAVHELINACLSKDPPPIESILLQLQEMASFDVADGQSSQTSLNSISTQNGKEYSSGQSLMIHLFNSLNPVNPYDFIAEFNKRFSQNRTLDSLALEREINLLPVIDAESLNRLIFSDIDKCNDSSALCKDDIEAIDLFLDKFDASSSIKQVCLGRKYLELKNEEYAFKWFQMAANSGDPIGQYNLSHCYMHGLGVTKSDAKSLEWLILSAKSGEATALNDLGMKYYYGHDVAKDHQLALQYVCRAALASNPAACYNLGYFYENGADSVPIDINEAIIWYTQAHKCHFPLAAFKLGMLMKEGVHIPRDDKGALKMFKIAAASKNLDASFQVYEYYLNAKVTGHDESRALKWLSRTADAGHMESQYRLGRAFRYGLLGCQISPLKAIEYFKMAAAKGHWLSCYEIGLCYSSGVGIGKNSSKAKKYFGQAIKSADPNSKYEYAMCLMKEYNEADGCDGFMKLFLEAGQAGTVEACVQLATIYEQGLFEIPSDDEKKIYWLQKASEKGHISSSTKLGCIYLSDKKESEGIELIKLAADTKYPEAIYQLAIAYREGLGVQQSFQTSFQMLSQKCLATHEKARVALGLCYWHGTGTIRNEKRAFEIISNCGLQDVHSLHLMATAYHEGIGVPINAYKAVEYYRQAASRSYAPSEYCLGRAYLTGKGAPQHISHARHYLELSSGKNYRPAQTLLATLYITGRGVSKNHDRAFKLFLRSANEGDAIAINQVALCYLKGKGVGVDFDKAREWFEKGAQLGYEPCKKNLKILDLNPVLRC